MIYLSLNQTVSLIILDQVVSRFWKNQMEFCFNGRVTNTKVLRAVKNLIEPGHVSCTGRKTNGINNHFVPVQIA